MCVLGAGNCNDLDLPWLKQVFADVHLVDIDVDAVNGAVRRQGVEGVVTHAPVDLTAVADVLSTWRKAPLPGDEEIARLVRTSEEAALPDLGRRFDVVLSPCVLTQILNPLRQTITRNHPRFDEALRAMRGRHLRLMSSLLTDGGRGVLLIDLVSSEAYDELARVPEGQLPAFMDKFVDRGKAFAGLDPRSIRRAFHADSSLSTLADGLRMGRPWLWHLSLRRTFLVYAVEFTRRALGAGTGCPAGSRVV